jgi:tryptophan synthase alpha chain
MNRIDQRFQEIRASKRKALIPFITAGDPDFATTQEMVWAFEEAGADLLELGVPFSDPLADGTTIQRASQRALEHGVTLKGVIALVERIRVRSQIPVILMSYVNPILRMGAQEFATRAGSVGVDGVVIPDLPPEEAQEVLRSFGDSYDFPGGTYEYRCPTPPDRGVFSRIHLLRFPEGGDGGEGYR